MREIKFRAWDKVTNKYWNVAGLSFDKGRLVEVYLENYPTSFEGNEDCKNPDEVILEQYTGEFDKNGKEICEGDIVKIEDDIDTYGMNAGEVYEVYFNAGGFRLKPKYKLSITRGCRGYWVEDGEDLTVIGTIHENRELLGDTNVANKEEE